MNGLHLLLALSALVAAVNPPSMAIVVLSVSTLLGKGKHPRHASLHISLFALGTFIAQILATTLFWILFTYSPLQAVNYIAIALGIVIVGFGLLEIKDYYWYGRRISFSYSKKAEQAIHAWVARHHSHFRGFMLGVFSSLKLTHYTLVLSAASALLIALYEQNASQSIALWGVMYSLPIISIALLTRIGMDPQALTSWREETKHVMRLSVGLIYVIIGWLILTLLAGGLNLI